jgi:hypothetical protein
MPLAGSTGTEPTLHSTHLVRNVAALEGTCTQVKQINTPVHTPLVTLIMWHMQQHTPHHKHAYAGTTTAVPTRASALPHILCSCYSPMHTKYTGCTVTAWCRTRLTEKPNASADHINTYPVHACDRDSKNCTYMYVTRQGYPQLLHSSADVAACIRGSASHAKPRKLHKQICINHVHSETRAISRPSRRYAVLCLSLAKQHSLKMCSHRPHRQATNKRSSRWHYRHPPTHVLLMHDLELCTWDSNCIRSSRAV